MVYPLDSVDRVMIIIGTYPLDSDYYLAPVVQTIHWMSIRETNPPVDSVSQLLNNSDPVDNTIQLLTN